MYRDATEAAERRIEELEDRVSEQAALIGELKTRLDARDDYVTALSRKLDGRTGAPERIWRNTAVALLVALAATLVYAQTRVRAATPQVAEGPTPTPSPTLADPIAPRHAEALAGDETPPPQPGACDPDDPLCEAPANPAKVGLVAKLEKGTATLDELRMLKALCMMDGDTACRAAAMAAYEARTGKAPPDDRDNR